VYKRDYAFRMNVMEEIFEIRSCIEILANDIKVNTADEYYALGLQLTEIIARYAFGGSSSFIAGKTKNVLNICDLFEGDYKEFVLGELTELWDTGTYY